MFSFLIFAFVLAQGMLLNHQNVIPFQRRESTREHQQFLSSLSLSISVQDHSGTGIKIKENTYKEIILVEFSILHIK